MQRLLRYFTEGIEDCPLAASVGMEVETSFVDSVGSPITATQSQEILSFLVSRAGWRIAARKGVFVTEVTDENGNRILYELGRQNIELSAAPGGAEAVVPAAQRILGMLYEAGKPVGALPHFAPVLATEEELLVIPDERDANWLTLDGRPALELLARTSAVQFTIAVAPQDAIRCLNRLGESIGRFIRDYPQDEHWRRYIRESRAGYHPLRYGGPIFFDDLRGYCAALARHDVVSAGTLTPFSQIADLNIPLFLRSIWWYFRLKRYGNRLCIEVRPLPRRTDDVFQLQLDFVLNAVSA